MCASRNIAVAKLLLTIFLRTNFQTFNESEEITFVQSSERCTTLKEKIPKHAACHMPFTIVNCSTNLDHRQRYNFGRYKIE